MSTAVELPDLDSLWDFEQLERSEDRFQDVLLKVKGSEAADHTYLVELLSQLARAQCLRGKLESARQTLLEAKALLGQEGASCRVVAKVRFRLELGRAYVLEKQPSQARPLFLEAWTLAVGAGEIAHAIDAAQMLAAVEPLKARKDWVLKALALAEGSSEPRALKFLGSLYTALGWMQFEVRQFEAALATFQKALGADHLESTPRRVLVAKWAVARVLRAMNRVDEALAMQKDLQGQLERMGLKDGLVFEEVAECLQTQKQSSEAQVFFELAYRELEKDEWLKDNKPERLKRLKELGRVK